MGSISASNGDSSTILINPSASSSDSFLRVGHLLHLFLKAKLRFLHLKHDQSPGLSANGFLTFSITLSSLHSFTKLELQALLGLMVSFSGDPFSIGSKVITTSSLVFSLRHRLHFCRSK